MSELKLQHLDKIYDNKVQAVFDFNLDVKDHFWHPWAGIRTPHSGLMPGMWYAASSYWRWCCLL